MLFRHFGEYEPEAKRLIEAQCVLPAYEMVMKCSHTFNLLDARGAISVTERAAYIGRVRALARAVAQAYYESRERLGFPMVQAAVTRRNAAGRAAHRGAAAEIAGAARRGVCRRSDCRRLMQAPAARIATRESTSYATPRRLAVAIDEGPRRGRSIPRAW